MNQRQKENQNQNQKQKIKTFDDYFQECIKNKTFRKDTSPYLKKALERAIKEYNKGIKHEKSALSNFAEKYVIDGKPKMPPNFYFSEKLPQLIEFLRNHRNIKVRMILVCIMKVTDLNPKVFYFHSKTFLNIESTDVRVILFQMIKYIKNSIMKLTEQDSGWYFEEVIRLEIHTVDYKPMKGESYIPLPDFIMRKKAIINMENKDDKCFLWSVLRYLHPVQKNASRINDLREYENDLNFKGINFPVKLKDIQKFENQTSDLPGMNVFSINDNNKIYLLRLS